MRVHFDGHRRSTSKPRVRKISYKYTVELATAHRIGEVVAG